MYKELKDLGVIFVSKNEQFDTSTAMGEAMLKIILVFAELERNMTSERVTATMISRANNGQWNGGRIPFGYDYDPETGTFSFNEAEKAVVIMIHDTYEEQHSLVREARLLNEKGYRSRSGNLWSPVTLLIILRSTFYCGDYQYNRLKEGDRQKLKDKSEWITIENHHPAMVSREQKEHIIAILDAKSKQYSKGQLRIQKKHTHVFGGLVYCGNCGAVMPNSIGNKRDWSYTKYLCPTKRKSSVACTGKATSDPMLGEFIFNYLLNMLNAQRTFNSIQSPEKLQECLLLGDTFNEIDRIDQDGLNDLYNVLVSGKVKGKIYGKNVKVKPQSQADSELSKLRNEKQRLERAMDRLTNLYLYSEDTMSEREYLIQKTKLLDAIDEVNEQIGFTSSDGWQQSISDEVFIQRASEFIISQKLTNRNYINYKRLATSVDTEVLKSFILSIIDSITIYDGMIQTITFKNGLSHTFIYKNVESCQSM